MCRLDVNVIAFGLMTVDSWQDDMQRGLGSSNKPPPIYVVEQHGSVAKFWFDELEYRWDRSRDLQPVSLLHVDSHSDMLSNTWDESYRDIKDGDIEGLVAALYRDLNIGDFIATAMYAKLVDDVVWLRSDFEIGEYNGPLPGKYEVEIGMSKRSMKVYKDGNDILCFRTKRVLHSPPNETIVNLRAETLDSCKSASFDSRAAHVTVATMQQLPPISNFFTQPVLSHKKWILDIDLDFFSTSDPCLALFANYGFTARWVTSHVQHSLHCKDDDKALKMVAKLFRAMGRQLHTYHGAEQILRSAGFPCKIQRKFHRLWHAVARFTAKRRSEWSQLWSYDTITDWTGDLLTAMFDLEKTISPHHLSSKAQIHVLVQQFEGLLVNVIAQNGKPELVTISRSMEFDHYLPSGDLDHVEGELFDVLRRVLGYNQLNTTCYLGETGELNVDARMRGKGVGNVSNANSRWKTNCHLDHKGERNTECQDSAGGSSETCRIENIAKRY